MEEAIAAQKQKALIKHWCINPVDRLFYLQKYISGEAKSVVEGTFYRKDDEAYNQAWEALNARYGHPFVIQCAYREKLNNWSKIGSRESVKLRQFSDFSDSLIYHANMLISILHGRNMYQAPVCLV